MVAKIREWGWEPEVNEVAPGRPNVIFTLGGGEPGPVIGSEGHLDVVTEGERGEWSSEPSGAEIVDGRLYGRSSMKRCWLLIATVSAPDVGDFRIVTERS